jgi:hypothetical protein
MILIGIHHHYSFSANSLPSPGLLAGNFLVFPTLPENLRHEPCVLDLLGLSDCYLSENL